MPVAYGLPARHSGSPGDVARQLAPNRARQTRQWPECPEATDAKRGADAPDAAIERLVDSVRPSKLPRLAGLGREAGPRAHVEAVTGEQRRTLHIDTHKARKAFKRVEVDALIAM